MFEMLFKGSKHLWFILNYTNSVSNANIVNREVTLSLINHICNRVKSNGPTFSSRVNQDFLFTTDRSKLGLLSGLIFGIIVVIDSFQMFFPKLYEKSSYLQRI